MNRDWILSIFKTWDPPVYRILVSGFVNVRRRVDGWSSGEIANGNWIISFKVTPRFIESSRGEGKGKRDGRTVGSRRSDDFCVTFSQPIFIFSPLLLAFSSLFTFHDEWPFLPPFFSVSLQHFASVFSVQFPSAATSTSNAFLTGADLTFIFNLRDGYRWLSNLLILELALNILG